MMMYRAKLDADVLLRLYNSTNPLQRVMGERRKGFNGRSSGADSWHTDWLPHLQGQPAASQREAPPAGALGEAALQPWPPGGAVGPRERAALGLPAALTCSALTRAEVSPPAASRPLPANQECPLRAPGLRSGPAAPDAALPDGDMGDPPVPEAGSWRWGPVLLAFFLAASRGKVGGAWVLGRSNGRAQRGRVWGGVPGQMGAPWEPPSACRDPSPRQGGR